MRQITLEERKWIDSLKRLAKKQPPGLALLTIGDNTLTVIDHKASQGQDLHDGAHEPFDLATLRFKNPIHGVSG